MNIFEVSLKKYTSLQIGGNASMVVLKTEADLKEVMVYVKSNGLRVHVLGSGTNTYFDEEMQNLLVLKNEIKGVEVTLGESNITGVSDDTHAEVMFTCGAGELWDDIVKRAISEKAWGIENLSYIPGTVGAAPVQNIGAYGAELQDSLVSVRAYDFLQDTFVDLRNEECHFSYRNSLFKRDKKRFIITSITLRLSKKRKPILSYKPLDILNETDVTLDEIRNFVIKTRTAKLPDYILYPNAGSFFKNPVVTATKVEGLRRNYLDIPCIPHGDDFKIPAAWLIEHVAEMKGVRIGNIGSWPNQPLVLVNYGQATASELEGFAKQIITVVSEKTGILLEKEVNYIK